MGKLNVTDFYLYRWRYILGVMILVGALIGVLAVAGFYVPGGLAAPEIESASNSIHTPPTVLNGSNSDSILHLPYHVLQKLSIQLLGVNELAVKLPSLLMAGTSILFIYGVVRLWFRRNVAIITSTIAVTSAQFLLLAQLGTPAISYIFWSAAVLFSTSMLAYSEKYRTVWMITTSIVAALSLYAPLGIYLLLALFLTSLFHPHARFIVFSQPKLLLIVCTALFGLTAMPLILSIINRPNLLLDIIGITTTTTPTLESISSSVTPYVAFYAPSGGLMLQPVYGLATLLLVILGAVRLFSAKYTAKSYIISIVFLLVFVGIITKALPSAYTFIPAMLLVAFGINYLISSWYRLFPLNPYARVAGLLPLAVLVVGVSFTEFDRYVYTYHYTPISREAFTKDLHLLDQLIQKNIGNRITILVDHTQKPFYTDYVSRLREQGKISVVDKPAVAKVKAENEIIIAANNFKSQVIEPSFIAVTSQSNDAARFYLYKSGYR
ncbi:MAG TPA: glycosyltransferase family 39 protein [Candidatus Saccharimonadales bacterium]